MRGDFSRRTHRPNRHYSRVLLQQGRVILDADWNEQAEIHLRTMRQMMRDLVGPHGGPADALGFWVVGTEPDNGKVTVIVRNGQGFNQEAAFEGSPIGGGRPSGRYYVEGIALEHGFETRVRTDIEARVGHTLFVYLEVWERHVTWIEEAMAFQDRSMREVALGGPDTASRSQVCWRINVEIATPSPVVEGGFNEDWVPERLQELAPPRARMAAGLTKLDIGVGDPCRDSAQARYRGPENRLYRVEIHSITDRGPTFKWSRENGSVVYPVDLEESPQVFEGKKLTLGVHGLGRDDRYRLRRGNIVELVTADIDEAGKAGPLLEVVKVDDDARRVELRPLVDEDEDDDEDQLEIPLERWALLRRWDQPLDPKKENGSAAKIEQGAIVIDGPDRFVLEDGIVVQFQGPPKFTKFPEEAHLGEAVLIPKEAFLRDGVALEGSRESRESAGREVSIEDAQKRRREKGEFKKVEGIRVGDYWLIPARTIPGDIEWPQDEKGGNVFEEPHGVERYFAPLALIAEEQGFLRDYRNRFFALANRV
jgi:hypothetical protein